METHKLIHTGKQAQPEGAFGAACGRLLGLSECLQGWKQLLYRRFQNI